MLDLSRAEHMLQRLPVRHRFTRRLVPFAPNPSQSKLLQAMRKQQDAHRPVRIIVLKARRVGMSSLTDALGVLHGIADEGSLGMIVAHQFKSSKALFEVPINLVSRNLPDRPPLQTILGISYTKHRITIPRVGGDSVLDLATAGAVQSGRGMASSFLHLSEAAFFPGMESFASLLPTVAFDPASFIVVESTANGKIGMGAAFYEYWQHAVAGQNDYEAVFCPWHGDTTCIRPDSEADDAPADDYERWLMREFKCTNGQIAWWRATLETECKGNMALMGQEYPASPEEAFVSTGDPAFERDELEHVRTLVRDPEIVGDIKCPEGIFTTPHFTEHGSGDWAIYVMPTPGHKYFMGCDAARGMQLAEGDFEPTPEGDFASAVIWDGHTGELVARFAKRVNPERLAAIANAAGRFYNNAMVNIELTGNLGVWAQKVIRDEMHYPNIYRWRGTRDDKIGDMNRFHKRTVLGWETTVRTREMMMDAYRAGIRQQVCKPYDRALLGQMEVATRKEGFRWEVVRGHDDILVAAMIGWVTREQWGPAIGPAVHSASGSTMSKEPDTYGVKFVDDSALTLSKHYHKIMKLNKQVASGIPDPLLGV